MQTFTGEPVVARQPDHYVALYEHGTDLVARMVSFLTPALASGEMAVTALTAEHQEALDRELSRAGVDVACAQARGDYLWFDADEALARLCMDGSVSARAFRTMVDPILAAARHRECGVRFCGELAPQLWAMGDVIPALELESLWDDLPADPVAKIMCLYTMRQLESAKAEEVIDLCHDHTDIVPGGGPAPVDDPASRPVNTAMLLRAWCSARDQQRLFERSSELEAQLMETTARLEALQSHFQKALASRDLIGQAKGILMARWSIDAETAFELLCAASNLNNTKLRDVAQAAIDEARRQR